MTLVVLSFMQMVVLHDLFEEQDVREKLGVPMVPFNQLKIVSPDGVPRQANGYVTVI